MRAPLALLLLLLLALALWLGPAPAAADDTTDCKGVNSLSVGAREVNAGDALPVTWLLCAADGGDWIGLFEAGASNSAALALRFTGGVTAPPGGSVAFSIPSATYTGPYELRLFAGKTTNRLAQSPGFYVHGVAVPPTGTLSHVWTALAVGSYQTFSWTIAPPHGADHITVYQYGGGPVQTCYADASHGGQMYCYLDPATVTPGYYMGCLYSGLTGAQLACDSTFTVTP